MTTFIAATAKGDVADRLDRLQDDLRRRHDAVRPDAGHERDLDPLRPQVPAGVRMSASVADVAASAPRAPPIGASSGADRARGGLFRALLLSCILLSAALLVDAAGRRRPRRRRARSSWDFLTSARVVQPRDRRHRPGADGDAVADGRCASSSSSRSASPTAVYLEEYADATKWWNRAHRGQHPEPRRGPVDRLRHPRPGVHRARAARLSASAGTGRARRRADPRPARAARRDHRRARGDPRGAAVDPRGLAGARRDAVADDLEAGPARRRSRASRPA